MTHHQWLGEGGGFVRLSGRWVNHNVLQLVSITRHCQHTACDTVSPHMQCFPLNATITHLVNILGRVLFTFQQNALKSCVHRLGSADNREGRLGLVVSCSTPSPDEFPLSIFNPLMNMHANVHLVPVKDDIIQRVQRGRGFGGFLRMWRVVCGALQRSAKVPRGALR